MNMTNFPVTTRILSPCYRITTKALAKFLAYATTINFILYFLLDIRYLTLFWESQIISPSIPWPSSKMMNRIIIIFQLVANHPSFPSSTSSRSCKSIEPIAQSWASASVPPCVRAHLHRWRVMRSLQFAWYCGSYPFCNQTHQRILWGRSFGLYTQFGETSPSLPQIVAVMLCETHTTP